MKLTREEFEKSEIYKLLDEWVEQHVIQDYAEPGRYIDEGETWVEDKFDEEGFKTAKQSCYDEAWRLYKQFKESGDVNISKYLGTPNSDCVTISAIMFAIIIEDYPNIKPILGNPHLAFRSHVDSLTRLFMECTCLDEWLKLYAQFYPFAFRNRLPKLFQGERAMEVLNAFRKAGYLDFEYKPVKAKIRNNNVAAILCDVINYRITRIDGNVKWKQVGDYWGISNFKQYYYRAGDWKDIGETRERMLKVID